MVQGKEETEGRHGGLGLLGALHHRQHEHELGHERVSETNHDHEHDGGDVIVSSPMSWRPLRVMGVVRLMGGIVCSVPYKRFPPPLLGWPQVPDDHLHRVGAAGRGGRRRHRVPAGHRGVAAVARPHP